MTYAVSGKCVKQSGKSVRSVIRPPDAEDMHLAHNGVARRQSATTERDTMRDARMRSRYTSSVIRGGRVWSRASSTALRRKSWASCLYHDFFFLREGSRLSP